MNPLVNTVAQFLPMRKFRSGRRARTRAFLTAGYPRQGGGSKINGCVDVSVVDNPTSLTNPFSDGQRQRSFSSCSAVGTQLGRREPAVSNDDFAAGKRSLIRELTPDFRQGSICNRLCKMVICHHSFDVQVLDSNPTKVSDQPSGKLMCYVFADVGNPFMQPTKLHFSLLPISSSYDATRHFLVESSQSGFMSTQNAWSLDPFSRRKHGKVSEPEVHSNRFLGFAAMGIGPGVGDLNLDRDVPMTGMFRKVSGQDFTRKSYLLSSADPTKLGNLNSSAVKAKGSTFNGEGHFALFLRLEAGIAGLLARFDTAKEVGESIAEVGQRRCSNSPRQFCHPRKFGVFAGIQLGVKTDPRGLSFGFVLSFPTVQSPVVDEARCTSTTFEKGCLDVIWNESNTLTEDSYREAFFRSCRKTFRHIINIAHEVKYVDFFVNSLFLIRGESLNSCRLMISWFKSRTGWCSPIALVTATASTRVYRNWNNAGSSPAQGVIINSGVELAFV